jgi:hypothetical protein
MRFSNHELYIIRDELNRVLLRGMKVDMRDVPNGYYDFRDRHRELLSDEIDRHQSRYTPRLEPPEEKDLTVSKTKDTKEESYKLNDSLFKPITIKLKQDD